eukprot:TRINITY_DN3847_c0_g1_i1.p3 TRINITY_DN3847_c0_g1~~TRINITY_DN3847_c0_g1_i1.p3  ORF type:complete len:69 (+),score=19.66 TRINITY_DN3847_c0_g1_i1:79-285(+)
MSKKIAIGAMKAILYFIQNGLAYLLMLVVMTYNVGLFFFVIAGNTVGYIIFGLILKSNSSDPNPHDCH